MINFGKKSGDHYGIYFGFEEVIENVRWNGKGIGMPKVSNRRSLWMLSYLER